MKLYSTIIFITLISGAVILPSCKKSFLDINDNTASIRQTFVVDAKSANAYLNGIYLSLGSNFYLGYHQIYPELIADNMKLVTASSATLANFYNWSQPKNTASSTGTNMNGAWLNGYQIIRSCSYLLEVVDEYRNENEELVDKIKAQAYCLRALMHFELVNIYAQAYNYSPDADHLGIPYITSSDWTQIVKSRNSVSEVYTNIIKDLNDGILLFNRAPATAGELLVMNKNAAKALLARVYLFQANYTAAKNVAREIADAVPLLTIAAGYPGNLSKNIAPSQTEILLQLTPSEVSKTLPAPTGGTFTGSYNTNFQGRFLNFGAATLFIATSDIATLLKQNASDVRKNWIKTGTKDTIVKYGTNVIANFTIPACSYYQPLLRSSEMFLTAAEAYAKINMEDSARYFLDAVRRRANSAYPAVTATGSALLDSIYIERRKEMAFEGLRMYDLQRWKKSVNRTDAWSPAVQTLSFPNDRAISPIPENDVNINGISQNESY